MDDGIFCKDLKVLVPRLAEAIVESYFERYERNKNELELMIEDEEEEKEEDEEEEQKAPVLNTYLQETGLNVSLIAKNDKKLVKLNVSNHKLFAGGKDVSEEDVPMFENFDVDENVNLNDEDTADEAQIVRVATVSQDASSKTMSVCYQCSKCSKLFTHKLHLKSHMQQHCSVNMTSKSAASQSPPSPLPATGAKIICNECGKQFNSQSDFNRHLQLAHNAVKPYKCSICSMAFFDISSKNRHEKEHSGLKPYRCYICGFEFTRASNLRAHLIKLHSSEIGKSVIISKTPDNKLKFEFDLDAINIQREQQRLNKCRASDTPTSAAPTNAVIYIKDPNNKSSDVQYMVVYVDGKPIFVQNPKGVALPQQLQQTQKKSHQQQQQDKQLRATKIKTVHQQQQSQHPQPIAKIPYLLAAAAAASATNQNNSINRSPLGCIGVKKEKNDHEYQHLVSLFKQKNEKLFNPMNQPAATTPATTSQQNAEMTLLTNAQNLCL